MARKNSDPPAGAPVVTDKLKALKILNELIARIADVKQRGMDSPDFKQWKHDATVAVANIFGENSMNHRRFETIRYSPGVIGPRTLESHYVERWEAGLDEARAILKSFVDQVQTYWDDPLTSTGGQHLPPQHSTVGNPARKVFIVHGQDDGTKQAVARLLERLDIQPIILHEQPNQGRTVIEKFEAYSNVPFAIVLLTADDEGRKKGEPLLQKRARQNVILELGFFFGKLGRSHVCALYENGVEIPSDYNGVLFVEIDATHSWMYRVAKELKAAGLDVDMNEI